jgi:hypothetical protein
VILLVKKKKDTNTKVVSMKIDADLYEESKLVIPNRTKDYVEYLHRRIRAGSSSELIKMEIEDLDRKREELKMQYQFKVALENGSDSNILRRDIANAVETVTNIINNSGSIGVNKLKEIADINNIIVADLKAALPKDLQTKISKYHPEIKTKPGSIR